MKEIDQKDIETIIATYRSIRQNYQNRYRYEYANRFLEREINLKNKFLTSENNLILPNELSEEKLNICTRSMLHSEDLCKHFNEMHKNFGIETDKLVAVK